MIILFVFTARHAVMANVLPRAMPGGVYVVVKEFVVLDRHAVKVNAIIQKVEIVVAVKYVGVDKYAVVVNVLIRKKQVKHV